MIQAPPPAICIRQMSDSEIPDRYFIAFNDDPAQAYNQDAYEYLSVLVPQCGGRLYLPSDKKF